MERSRRTADAASCTTTSSSRSTVVHREQVANRLLERLQAPRSGRRSPMCWLTNACPSTTSVTVFLRSAPTRQHRARRPAAWRPRRARSRARGAARPDRTRRRARPNRRRAARSAARRRETRRRCPPAARSASSSSIRDRLARAIGAGHHQDVRRARGEQQMMQRRVGQHHAELALSGRDTRQLDPSRAPARSGARRRSSSASASGESSHQRARDVEILRHHRERLLLAELALAQRRDRRGIARIARQVIAAEPLDRDDATVRSSSPPGGCASSPSSVSPSRRVRSRAADRTGDRLRVKAPVERIVVLARAVRAQRPVRASSCAGGRTAGRG